MLEDWFFELARAFGKLFINPLTYWTIILVIGAGMLRVKQERKNFGTKIYDVFAEWKHTWIFSILCGLIISILLAVAGVIFTYETMLVLSAVMILLSITCKFTLLSPSYTVGLTYIALLFLPYFMQQQEVFPETLFSKTNVIGLSLLLGLFLLAEAVSLRKIKRNETFPALARSNRGGWIGQHHVRRLHVMPLFVLVPTGFITPFADYWPYIPLGEENTFGLLLVPFLVGFDFKVRSNIATVVAKRISLQIFLLGLIVLMLAAGSVYVKWLSFIAVIIAIIGQEMIHYRQRVKDKEQTPFYYQKGTGIQILGIIPGTPADRFDMSVGEKIMKVNGKKIKDEHEFYEALQDGGAYFKLDVIDDKGEVRFIQSALYEGEHHELGLLFTKEPYRQS
ncbi:PDZ domain-containing protein [Virgibacillus soli]|uniref:PDZ domain-containing protein n=1 Tax=Paracerasibacillus soli TaxID=480284 RepID=A0ABU5CRA3_9BACI|nr:PDZ domain-containing protein [Virgibacillus soli]MDY0408904.1 PDZ domain-containing protein [Virgibacillus soli]